MQKLIITLLLLITFQFASSQDTSDEYWDAILIAGKFYDDANYEEAAKAYEFAFQQENDEEMANHRLYAAASNCMIDNEEGTKENLFKIVDVATKTDRKRVLVNYQIFDKYKKTDWWKELHQKLDKRLADLIAHHKNLTVFKHGRTLKYSAIRINNKGDTLANTYIHMVPDGTGWGDEAASSQSQVIFNYEFSNQDSLDHIGELDSIIETRFWERHDTTGVIENKNQIWMHPFRSNEFFKTELAPFPLVKFPISDSLMQKEKSTIIIMNNWGLYSQSRTKGKYNYNGIQTKNYSFAKDLLCHKFTASGENTKFGTSTIEYYFNENFGFTEMVYHTYDGDLILFEIVEVRPAP